MQVRNILRVASVTFFLLAGVVGHAQTRPDFTGTWDLEEAFTRSLAGPGAEPERERTGVPRQGFSDQEPPMQDWAEAKYLEARQGVPNLYTSGGDEFDPTHSCFPHGLPRIYTTPRPFEMIQNENVLVQLFESDHWVRRIFTDGRDHPDGFPYTWMGHSIGRWDGDTLVVDTININSESWWLDNLAHPKTDQLRITERFQMPNDDTVEIAFTFDDPGAYTRPWDGHKEFLRAPAGYEVLEDVTCEDLLDLNRKGRY